MQGLSSRKYEMLSRRSRGTETTAIPTARVSLTASRPIAASFRRRTFDCSPAVDARIARLVAGIVRFDGTGVALFSAEQPIR
jgi:hypothetical protein